MTPEERLSLENYIQNSGRVKVNYVIDEDCIAFECGVIYMKTLSDLDIIKKIHSVTVRSWEGYSDIVLICYSNSGIKSREYLTKIFAQKGINILQDNNKEKILEQFNEEIK